MVRSPVSADFDKVKHRPHLKAFEKGKSGSVSSKARAKLAGIEGSSSPEKEAENLAERLPSRSAGPLKVHVEQSGPLEKRDLRIKNRDDAQKSMAHASSRSEREKGLNRSLGQPPKRGQDLSGRARVNSGPLKERGLNGFEREKVANTPFENTEEVMMLVLSLVIPPVAAYLEFEFGKEFWVSFALLFLSFYHITLVGASAIFTVIVVGMSRGWW